MAQDLRLLDRWFRTDEWPIVACPACLSGHLNVGSISTIASAASRRSFERTHNVLDLEGGFHGVLRCAIPQCNETVVVTGDYAVDVDTDKDGLTREYDFVRLRFARPTLRILIPPAGTPPSVSDAIESAASILWADANASANRLRVAIDELLTAYGMRRFVIRNHKRHRLSTHARIQEFRDYESLVADPLEAVKWIGNEGSHEATIPPL